MTLCSSDFFMRAHQIFTICSYVLYVQKYVKALKCCAGVMEVTGAGATMRKLSMMSFRPDMDIKTVGCWYRYQDDVLNI